MQNRSTLFAALAAASALAACNNSQPEVINDYDPQAEALANAAPVAPPPMVTASRTYRCRDNSLVYIDFYTNNTATIRTAQGAAPVATVTSPDGTAAYTGSGYSVSANAANITYSAPGKGAQACHT